jgi:hypothetical protein
VVCGTAVRQETSERAVRYSNATGDSGACCAADKNGTAERNVFCTSVLHRGDSFMLRPSYRQLKDPVTHRTGG